MLSIYQNTEGSHILVLNVDGRAVLCSRSREKRGGSGSIYSSDLCLNFKEKK